MNTFNTQKIFTTIIVLALLVLFGYKMFIKEDVTVPMSAASAQAEDDILVLVETLKSISIDESLFQSELFTGLRDFTVGLYPEQQGRPNPFAALGSDNANSAQSRTVVR